MDESAPLMSMGWAAEPSEGSARSAVWGGFPDDARSVVDAAPSRLRRRATLSVLAMLATTTAVLCVDSFSPSTGAAARRRLGSSLVAAGNGLISIGSGLTDAADLMVMSDESQNVASVDAEHTLAPTGQPTNHFEDWTIYFTDGMTGESYVWWMESGHKGVYASVLVDTTGHATGLALGSNDTTVYFADVLGSIWRVSNDGFDLLELVSYDGAPSGMDMHEAHDKLYWADTNGYVYSSKMDGTDAEVIISSVAQPFDVKVWGVREHLFISASADNAIFEADLNGGSLEVFMNVTSPRGIWVDSHRHYLYFTSLNDTLDFDDAGGWSQENGCVQTSDRSANDDLPHVCC
jgi:hypothetical protein